MLPKIQFILKNTSTFFIICLIFVSLISFFTYFYNYTNPPNLFWDENYHIASAYKYINHVFFMEPHPPLGKLFIAWGEQLLSPNIHLDTSSFITTDYIKDIPSGFSFAGVRLFPALFGALSGPLFFLVLYLLYPSVILAFSFSFLYLFDNAIIVHSRGAMLDSAGIFFSLVVLLYFLLLQKKKNISVFSYGIFGMLTGLVLAVKLNGAIFGMLFLFLLVKEVKQRQKKILVYLFVKKVMAYVLGIAFIFCGVYYIHINNGQEVMNNNYYEASGQLKQILLAKQTGNLLNYPLELREHLLFIPHYEKGVPQLDICKSGENGSYPLTWPFGNKSINYRWDKVGDNVRYLYLQGNPLIWGIGLVGLLLSFCLIVGHLVFRLPIKNKSLFFAIAIFTCLYVVYMTLTIALPRVLYLYHYFTPLIFSFILAYLQFIYIFEYQMKKNPFVYIGLLVCLAIIIAVFIFYGPFTYYLPLTEKEFQLRNWFSWWQLSCIK